MLPVAYVPTENNMSEKCAWVWVAALSEKSTSRTSARLVPVTGATSGRTSMNVLGRVRGGRLRIRLSERKSSESREAFAGSAPPDWRRLFARRMRCSSSGEGGMTQPIPRMSFGCTGGLPNVRCRSECGVRKRSLPSVDRQAATGAHRERHDAHQLRTSRRADGADHERGISGTEPGPDPRGPRSRRAIVNL